MVRTQPHRQLSDLEEIAPNRFMIYNPHAAAILKSEGTITGRLFALTTWRREGLLGRLRDRGFHVLTLNDQMEALPRLPPPPPIGGTGWRSLARSIEQISTFDLRKLRWRTVTPEVRNDVEGVVLYAGWVVRRRKGRGAASYYLALAERGGSIGLRPLDEVTAILTGYAQALLHDDRPLIAEQHGERIDIRQIELPLPYRVLLERIATPTAFGWSVQHRWWPLVAELFLRLGMRFTIEHSET